MNKALDKEVAEKVMGWKLEYPERMSGDHFSAHGDAHRYGLVEARYPNGMTEKEFNPSSDMNHAFAVISRMKELGYSVVMAEYDKERSLPFALLNMLVWPEEPIKSHTDAFVITFLNDTGHVSVEYINTEKIAEGICKCALKTIEQNGNK